MSIGRVLARAFGVIRAHPIAVFGIAFVVAALPAVGLTAILNTLSSVEDPGHRFAVAPLAILGFLGSLVFTTLTQGASVCLAVARTEERRASIAEALWAALHVVVPLLLLGVLLAIGVVFGLILLLVPGVMLYVTWSVAASVLVEERCGVFQAFKRSRALTEGARWRIFALELVVLVLHWLIAAVVAIFVVGIIRAGEGAPIWIIAALSKTLTATVWATIQASLYVELRDWKDGPARERLADVFA